jgi:hypothetical protein
VTAGRAHLSAAWRCQCEAPEKAKLKAQRIHFLSASSRANHSHFLRTSRSGVKSAGRGRPALPALHLPNQKSKINTHHSSIKPKVTQTEHTLHPLLSSETRSIPTSRRPTRHHHLPRFPSTRTKRRPCHTKTNPQCHGNTSSRPPRSALTRGPAASPVITHSQKLNLLILLEMIEITQ